MKNKKVTPAPPARKFTVELTQYAAEYVAELQRKYRVTPEQIIQAAAEQTLGYAFDRRVSHVGPELEFEDDIIDNALALAETGAIAAQKYLWEDEEPESAPAQN